MKKGGDSLLSSDEYYTKASVDELLAQKTKEINRIKRVLRYSFLALLISLALLLGASGQSAQAERDDREEGLPGFAIYKYDEYGDITQVLPNSHEIMGDKSFYFDEYCIPATGWICTPNNRWSYYPEDHALLNGWQKMDGKWYYFSQNRCRSSGKWYVDGKYYYFSETGAMETGWKQINGKWYYFRKKYGDMAQSEYVDGYWLGEDGVWDNESRAEWHEDETGRKYYNDAGVGVQNRTVIIDGKEYAFDENGYLIED